MPINKLINYVTEEQQLSYLFTAPSLFKDRSSLCWSHFNSQQRCLYLKGKTSSKLNFINNSTSCFQIILLYNKALLACPATGFYPCLRLNSFYSPIFINKRNRNMFTLNAITLDTLPTKLAWSTLLNIIIDSLMQYHTIDSLWTVQLSVSKAFCCMIHWLGPPQRRVCVPMLFYMSACDASLLNHILHTMHCHCISLNTPSRSICSQYMCAWPRNGNPWFTADR